MIKEISNFIPFFLIPFIGWGVTRYLKKKNRFTPFKKATLYIGLGAYFITEMVRSFWRPYAQQNGIVDFNFSDTIGNSFGTMTAIFMILTLSGKGEKRDWRFIAIIIIGLIVYEYLNPPSRFDFNDVIATIIFGSLSLVLYLYLLYKFNKSNI